MQTLRILTSVLVGVVIAGSVQLWAGEPKTQEESKAFKKIKQLVGTWEGEFKMGDGPPTKNVVAYQMTAGGSAVLETSHKGTPMEMVTLYHDNQDGQLTLTHYCMLGNQPKMTLIASLKNELRFKLDEDLENDLADESHMHAVTIKFDGNDRMSQRWTVFEDGKAGPVVEVVYHRVKE